MRIAIVAAQFKPEEADRLRRAMATFKRVGTIKQFRAEIHRRHDQPRLRARIRRALLRADRRLRRIRLSGKPCRELRDPGLCLGLDQMPLPGRVRGGAAQQPADGLLRAGADRARRAGAWRRGAAGGRQPLGLGLLAGRRPARRRARCIRAMPACATISAPRMRCGSASARSAASPRTTPRRSKASAARVSIPCATSGCARG